MEQKNRSVTAAQVKRTRSRKPVNLPQKTVQNKRTCPSFFPTTQNKRFFPRTQNKRGNNNRMIGLSPILSHFENPVMNLIVVGGNSDIIDDYPGGLGRDNRF